MTNDCLTTPSSRANSSKLTRCSTPLTRRDASKFALAVAAATFASNSSATRARGRVRALEEFGGEAGGYAFDNYAAFQRALAHSVETGEVISLGSGHYHTARPIRLVNGRGGRAGGPELTGAGAELTRVSYGEGGFIKVRGIPERPIASSGLGAFFFGGGFSNLALDGTRSTSGNAVEISGWWDARFNGLAIRNSAGDGVAYAADQQYHKNPDWSASGRNVFEHCTFSDLHGWGIRCEPIASHTFTFDSCAFSFCKSGGIFLVAPGSRVIACAFNRIGWRRLAGGVLEVAYDAVALHIGNVKDGAQLSRFDIRLCEFDSATGAYCVFENARLVSVSSNRLIFRLLEQGEMRMPVPRSGFVFAPSDQDQAVSHLVIEGLEYRLDFESSEAHGVALFDLRHAANVKDISIGGVLKAGAERAEIQLFCGRWAALASVNRYKLPTRF